MSDALSAVDALIAQLETGTDHQALFYAWLLRKRVELGCSPFPLGPASDLPESVHLEYEEAIRSAARHVGNRLLTAGDIPAAWPYFRMLGEPEPVRDALLNHTPPADADIYPLVEVAWQQLVAPEKGFDLVLDTSGLCSAVTLVQSADLSRNPAVRDHCVNRLVEAISAQLADRLRADIRHRGKQVPDTASIPDMVRDFPEVFADENYHVDVSHLASVVQLSLQLPAGDLANRAWELCVYGEHLAENLRGNPGPPFEHTYTDYAQYLNVTTGHDVAGGLAHFEAKLKSADADDARFVAEVLVTLNLRAGRPERALKIGREFLSDIPAAHLTCPPVDELAKRTGDYAGLAAAAAARGDVVTALAARIAGGQLGLV